MPDENNDLEFYKSNKYFGAILKEYRFSKGMEATLMMMKKFEYSQLIFKQVTYLNRGEDFKKVEAYFKSQDWQFNQQYITENKISIVYDIKLWFFNEGHNTFTLDMDERKQFYDNKKKIAVEFIKKEDYKKALKLFEKCH